MKYDEDIIFLCAFFDEGKLSWDLKFLQPRLPLFQKENNNSSSSQDEQVTQEFEFAKKLRSTITVSAYLIWIINELIFCDSELL